MFARRWFGKLATVGWVAGAVFSWRLHAVQHAWPGMAWHGMAMAWHGDLTSPVVPARAFAGRGVEGHVAHPQPQVHCGCAWLAGLQAAASRHAHVVPPAVMEGPCLHALNLWSPALNYTSYCMALRTPAGRGVAMFRRLVLLVPMHQHSSPPPLQPGPSSWRMMSSCSWAPSCWSSCCATCKHRALVSWPCETCANLGVLMTRSALQAGALLSGVNQNGCDALMAGMLGGSWHDDMAHFASWRVASCEHVRCHLLCRALGIPCNVGGQVHKPAHAVLHPCHATPCRYAISRYAISHAMMPAPHLMAHTDGAHQHVPPLANKPVPYHQQLCFPCPSLCCSAGGPGAGHRAGGCLGCRDADHQLLLPQ